MSTPGNSHGGTSTPPKHSTVILLLGDIADTTWRMFSPIILFTAVGIWADTGLNTGPWFSLLGVFAGSFIAALLIKKQLTKVKNTK